MAPRATEQLKTYLDRILEQVPADKRDAVRADYSRAQDLATAVDTTATRQAEWWEGNKDAVAERDRLRAAATTPTSTISGLDATEVDNRIAKASQQNIETGLGLITIATTIAAQHLNEFKEPLDMTKLTQEAIAAKMPLDQYYHGFVAPRRVERQNAQIAADKEVARKEGIEAGRKEVMDSLGQTMPYPMPNQGIAAPTTLSGLRKPANGEARPDPVDAAVRTAVEVMNRQNA